MIGRDLANPIPDCADNSGADQPLIEAAQQRTTDGQGEAAVHDVAGKLGRALVERGLDDVHDSADGSAIARLRT